MAKYRDRKLGRTFSLAGWDCYADTTARGHIRNAFEVGTGIVANWDVMEHVLDYVFLKLGMNGVEGGIDRPIVMTEAVANLPYSRKCEYMCPEVHVSECVCLLIASMVSNVRDCLRMLRRAESRVRNRLPILLPT